MKDSFTEEETETWQGQELGAQESAAGAGVETGMEGKDTEAQAALEELVMRFELKGCMDRK